MPIRESHFVNGTELKPPFPAGLETAVFGMGCFWGAEKRFWELEGVYTTAVGYAGGSTPNPSYEEVCSGLTGHTEAVLVVFDPKIVTYVELLRLFWEMHDPTTLNSQGMDVGTQYRSVVFFHDPEQEASALASKERHEASGKLRDPIVTEIVPAPPFYPAEDYHQRYIEKRGAGRGRRYGLL